MATVTDPKGDLRSREDTSGFIGGGSLQPGQSGGISRGENGMFNELTSPEHMAKNGEDPYDEQEGEEGDDGDHESSNLEDKAREHIEDKLKGDKEGGEGEGEGGDGGETGSEEAPDNAAEGENAPGEGAEGENAGENGPPEGGEPGEAGGEPGGAEPGESGAPSGEAPEPGSTASPDASGGPHAGEAPKSLGSNLGHEAATEAATKVGAEVAEDALEAGAEAVGEAAATAGAEAAATAAVETGAVATAAAGAEAGAAGTAAAAGAATSETGVGAIVGFGIAGAIVVGGFVIRHWKAVLEVVGLVCVGALIAGALLMNVFKPIASTVQTAQKTLSPVQQIVDNRSTKILARYVTGASSAATTASSPDGLITDGKLKTLFDAMKKDGFELRVRQKYGLEFKAASGAINITRNGNSMGLAHNTNEAELILREEFPNLQQLLGEEMNSWTWAQHTKVAPAAKSQYGLPGLSIPGAEEAVDSSQLASVVKYQLTSILKPGLDNMRRGLACFTQGTECNDYGATIPPEAEAAYQADKRSSLSTATQTAYDENLKNITPETDYDAPRLDASTKLKVTTEVQEKAVGLLGWLDIAATMQKLSQKEEAQQLPALLRSKQAGSLWAWNLSASNQILAGDVTSPAASLITRNYKSIEGSQGFNYIAYDDPSRGEGMPESNKVNSMVKNGFGLLYQSLLLENPIIKGPITGFFNIWLAIHKSFPGRIIDSLADTRLGDYLSRTAAFILQEVGLLPFISQVIGMSSNPLLPVCDAMDKTVNFFNCMVSGANAMKNYVCITVFGCAIITMEQEAALKKMSQKDMNDRVAAMPLFKRLFDRTVPNSFVNIAALNSPLPLNSTDNVASLVQGVFGAVASTPSRIAAIAAAPAHAAGGGDSSFVDGQEHYGIPLDQLKSAALSPQLSTKGGVCPTRPAGEKPGDKISMCMADMATVDPLIARFTYNPNYGGQ